MTYNQFVPYTDRLDYLALLPIMWLVPDRGKSCGNRGPCRCQAIRVLVCEMARISVIFWVWEFGMDAGARTPFMYTFTEREKLYTLFED